MKTMLTLLAITALTFMGYGQQAMTFTEAEANGIHIPHLDSMYKSGVHVDSSRAVFHNRQEEYFTAYYTLLQDLGVFLQANNFYWDNPTRSFNRIYFDKTGKIDYFLYNFSPGQLTIAQEKEFKALVNKFIIDYRFALTAEVDFAQCSPVKYTPANK